MLPALRNLWLLLVLKNFNTSIKYLQSMRNCGLLSLVGEELEEERKRRLLKELTLSFLSMVGVVV